MAVAQKSQMFMSQGQLYYGVGGADDDDDDDDDEEENGRRL